MPEPRWKVDHQTEATELQANGQFAKGISVSFITRDNVRGSVFVPLGRYNADYVKQAIEERVVQIEAVHKLQGMG